MASMAEGADEDRETTECKGQDKSGGGKVKTWAIHEIADACLMTTGELSQWISRGHYRPSEGVRPGQRRRFDWRDLACLAVINALRPHCLSINAMGLIAGALRDDLAEIDDLPEKPEFFFFDALWAEGEHRATCGLASKAGLASVFNHHLESCIIVNVSKVYHRALARLTSEAT